MRRDELIKSLQDHKQTYDDIVGTLAEEQFYLKQTLGLYLKLAKGGGGISDIEVELLELSDRLERLHDSIQATKAMLEDSQNSPQPDTALEAL